MIGWRISGWRGNLPRRPSARVIPLASLTNVERHLSRSSLNSVWQRKDRTSCTFFNSSALLAVDEGRSDFGCRIRLKLATCRVRLSQSLTSVMNLSSIVILWSAARIWCTRRRRGNLSFSVGPSCFVSTPTWASYSSGSCGHGSSRWCRKVDLHAKSTARVLAVA